MYTVILECSTVINFRENEINIKVCKVRKFLGGVPKLILYTVQDTISLLLHLYVTIYKNEWWYYIWKVNWYPLSAFRETCRISGEMSELTKNILFLLPSVPYFDRSFHLYCKLWKHFTGKFSIDKLISIFDSFSELPIASQNLHSEKKTGSGVK